MVGGLAYQWSDDICQFLGHTICYFTSAGHNWPEEGTMFMDFVEDIEFWVNRTSWVKSFISTVNWSVTNLSSAKSLDEFIFMAGSGVPVIGL